MDIGIDFRVGADGEAHVRHFGCAAPAEENGVIGEFEVDHAILGVGAGDFSGLHAVVDEDVVQNFDVALEVVELDAVFGGV